MNTQTHHQDSFQTMITKSARRSLTVMAFVFLMAFCLGCDFGNSGFYKASAWLRYEDNGSIGLGRNEEERARFAETQRAMILSPLVLDPVLARPDVARISEINSAASPVGLLLQRVTVEQSETNDLWIISCQANDPEDAATITNAVVESYFRMMTQDSSSRTIRRVEQLEEERERQKNRLQLISEELNELEKQNTSELNGLGKQWTKEALYQSFLRLREQQDAVALKLVMLELQASGAKAPKESEAKTDKNNAVEDDANSDPEESAENNRSLDAEQQAELKELQLQSKALKVREAEVLKALTELSADTRQDWEFQSRNDEREALIASIEKLSDHIRRLQVELRLPSRVTLLRKAEPPSEREKASP